MVELFDQILFDHLGHPTAGDIRAKLQHPYLSGDGGDAAPIDHLERPSPQRAISSPRRLGTSCPRNQKGDINEYRAERTHAPPLAPQNHPKAQHANSEPARRARHSHRRADAAHRADGGSGQPRHRRGRCPADAQRAEQRSPAGDQPELQLLQRLFGVGIACGGGYRTQAWCADFVKYVWRAAGVLDCVTGLDSRGTPVPGVVGKTRALSEHFTVISFDRRRRGASGDPQPYDPARERQDIAALVDIAGGSAALTSGSGGCAIALDAASALGTK